MAFNYGNVGNQTLENMLPFFGAMSNGDGALANHPTFINRLAAAINAANANTTQTMAASSAAVSLVAQGVKRDKTPEPPPAPKLSSLSPIKIKPNRGTAPMDLENESETEIPTSSSLLTTITSAGSMAAATKPQNKMPLNIHDPNNLYLNGLMSMGMNPSAPSASAYMFFPTTTAAGPSTHNANASAATNAAMLMDPTAMMAAAMQQMQQGYAASYAMPDNLMSDATTQMSVTTAAEHYATTAMKDVVKTKSSILFPPNPNAPPPTIRERPPGCRTVFVGGLPENISEEIIREIFESCGEITTLRMSKKNFCHIRYRHETAIDRAIYLSGYRVRISNVNEPANFGRLHVDYAQARDDQYDYECKQRQLQREQRHRERVSLDRLRSQSPPPMPHYSDHEASLVAENLRNNDTFVKAVQTISVWLERGDCTKRNANVFYSMIQSTHAHVRRLHTDKQQLEDDLRKTRENHRKQMLSMSTQFTQIEKVFNAASHKKVWDHFSKAQRKNIDQWKKLATELRSVQIEDDEMEMSDDDRDYHSSRVKRSRYDSDSLKEENDSLRCQLEALRNEMSLERSDIKCNSDFREKQIKVLQETIRNMQTQLLQTKLREQKDAKTIEQLERKLKEAGVKQLLLKTKIKQTTIKLKDKEVSPVNSETGELLVEEQADEVPLTQTKSSAIANKKEKPLDRQKNNEQIIDIDIYDDDVKIIEEHKKVIDITETDEKEQQEKMLPTANELEMTNKKLQQQTSEDTKGPAAIVPTTLAYCEAKIIALSAAYLVVHPFGVSSEKICQYLRDMLQSKEFMEMQHIDDILEKYTNLFKAELIEITNHINTTNNTDTNTNTTTASIKPKIWTFCGYTKNEK